MRKLAALTAAFSLALFALATAQTEKAKPAEKSATITGQVVDYECCMKSGGKMLGGDHQECAEACLKAGLPIGILTKNNKMYLTVSSQMMSSKHRELLSPLVNKQVKVTGKLHTFAGSQAIAVESVEEAAPAAK